MENKNQMQIGTWDKISTENFEGIEKVKFEVNIPQKVVVINPQPKELTGEDNGIYYVFDVEQDSKKKIIQTSAWTLLRELKRIGLKAGMVLEITKKLAKGKQFFEDKEVK
jgi:hypothetical protein